MLSSAPPCVAETYLAEDSLKDYTVVEKFLGGRRKYWPDINIGRVLCLGINWRLEL
jgi:hypothetical protein